MKKLFFLTLFVLAVNGGFAQTSAAEHEWKATVKVVDENGLSVERADVKVGYFTNNDTVEIEGTTGTNGIFEASHATSTFNYVEYKLAFRVEKEGYYGTGSECDLGLPYDAVKWNPTITLLLKKVGKPIAMYAKSITSLRLPELNKDIGYDLMVGDWVGPYGKGVNADLFFTEKHTDPQSGYILSVSFPKPGDGIQEFTVPDAETGSGLRSSHEAPVDGYQPALAQTEATNPKRNFYFRVRTKLDENGNVVSARYGKIYGDLAQFTYYFNPTPNDRNIEFDPKQNLLGGLQSFEGVRAP
ncbi:MAG: hypothetical protein P4L87_11800 [Formivibrio sp.]|nr:hypothetical protein [Formivibrio sp.]